MVVSHHTHCVRLGVSSWLGLTHLCYARRLAKVARKCSFGSRDWGSYHLEEPCLSERVGWLGALCNSIRVRREDKIFVGVLSFMYVLF